MGDVSERPGVIEVPFKKVGEGILALSITTAEIEDGVGIELARDAVAWASADVYNDTAGEDEFEPMDVSDATNSVDDVVLCGILVAGCVECSNCGELRADNVTELAEPAAEPDNGCNVTVELTTA